MKTILIVSLLFKASLCLAQSKQLAPGDIALTGFNFRDPDEFSFITFTDLPEGTVIHFTDCGWKNDNSFRPHEGVITYTVPAGGKKAFEVITYDQDPGFTEEGVSGFFGFSLSGDQIIVYQGDFGSPSFLYAVNNYESSWQADAVDNNSSSLPPGLIPGLTAIALEEAQNQSYNCILESGNQSSILNALSNPANWDGSVNRYDLPSFCFDDALPVVFHNFFIEDGNYPLISCHLSSDEPFHLYLEWSEDGLTFNTFYYEYVGKPLQGKMKFGNLSYPEGYYRIRIMSDSGEIYSEIKHFKTESTEIVSIQLFTLEGVLIYEGKDSSEALARIKSFPKNRVLIQRTIYPTEIKVEKLLRNLY